MLEHYWKLVSTDTEERRAAAYALVASLKEAQGQEGPLVSDVDYAIKRLVRGLSSSTEAARQVVDSLHSCHGPASRLDGEAELLTPPVRDRAGLLGLPDRGAGGSAASANQLGLRPDAVLHRGESWPSVVLPSCSCAKILGGPQVSCVTATTLDQSSALTNSWCLPACR
jgi:hypothetical protein